MNLTQLRTELHWYWQWAKVITFFAVLIAVMVIIAGLAFDLATGHGCVAVIHHHHHVIRRACRGW